MGWALCIKDLESGKVTLIRPDEVERFEAPKHRHEFHIVPIDENKVSEDCVSYGFHDFVRDCVCHPKIQVQSFGRTIISHKAEVN
jgi:hypothetical protein